MSNNEFSDSNGNGKDRELFREYRRLILSELERLGREQERFSARTEQKLLDLEHVLMAKMDTVKSDVSDLKSDFRAHERERKVLSSVWGLLGGAIPIVMWLFYQLLSGAGG
jgi:hypothetical protein